MALMAVATGYLAVRSVAEPFTVPWEDLMIEVIFMAAIWIPLMLLEAVVEFAVAEIRDRRNHARAQELIMMQVALENVDEEESDEDE